MKEVPKLLVVAFFTACMTIFPGCKRNAEIPTLITTGISTITTTSAETGGNVTSSGGEAVTARGVCWGTAHSPTVAGSKTIDGTGSGAFTSSITGLTPNSAYYVRAYATNGVGTAYGNEISFTAQIAAVTLTTTPITEITESSAVTGGNIISNGGATVTDWGICWNTTGNPTTANNKISSTGSPGDLGIFISNLTILTQGTTYFVRAYAVNSAGTAYGNEISFSTLNIVTTTAIVSFTSTSAVVTGNVINGQNTGNHLIGSGVCWNTSENPTTVDSKTMNATYSGIFTSNLTGLAQGTTYYVRAYAEYDNGPAIYGNELSFTSAIAQGTGIQKADFPGGPRIGAKGFSIGTKIYMGLGNDGENQVSDFWEWDQTSYVWTRKADFPGNLPGEVGFSIGIKGYIEAGMTNEFWEYDPATNTWIQKSSFPGKLGLVSAVGFSIGPKGYIGTGYLDDGYAGGVFSQEFWEWDQATNIWTKKADFPGNERSNAVGFSIGSKGYIGTGSGQGSTAYTDFWEWDQATDAWTRKADFAGTARQSAVGFSIGNKGYIGTGLNYSISGTKKDFWEWDQATNVWTRKANLTGTARSWAIGFSIGNNSYIGTGSGSDSNNFGLPLQDFWEYDPTIK